MVSFYGKIYKLILYDLIIPSAKGYLYDTTIVNYNILLPLFLTAKTITIKTKAPQNRNAVFQYSVPRGYDKNRREMYRVLVIFRGLNTTSRKRIIYPYFIKSVA